MFCYTVIKESEQAFSRTNVLKGVFTMRSTSYRIKKAHREAVLNRQRRLALGAAAAIVLLVWFINMSPVGSLTSEAADRGYICVSVHGGDTIWSVAEEYRPDNTDIRAFAHEIAAVNDIEDHMIYEGQVLKIPN